LVRRTSVGRWLFNVSVMTSYSRGHRTHEGEHKVRPCISE
jgi:hypothetical protein